MLVPSLLRVRVHCKGPTELQGGAQADKQAKTFVFLATAPWGIRGREPGGCRWGEGRGRGGWEGRGGGGSGGHTSNSMPGLLPCSGQSDIQIDQNIHIAKHSD